MTNEQIDRLAAEKVMLWRANQMGIYVMTCRESASIIKAGIVTVNNFSPTTNEAHAAMVREKMRELGWYFVAKIETNGLTLATFHRDGGYPYIITHLSGDLKYCITAAAMLAVGACREEEING